MCTKYSLPTTYKICIESSVKQLDGDLESPACDHGNGIFMCTPLICTNAYIDPGCMSVIAYALLYYTELITRTVLVIGCTGRGKSTFCNFLFREERFKSDKTGWRIVMSDQSKTQMSQLVDRIAGVTLTVIDTPGFLATQHRCSNNQGGDDSIADVDALLHEFSRAVAHAKNGIDAILVTLRCAEPASKEEQLLMEFLTEMQLWNHCIILFTHGARVSQGKDEGYMELHGMLNSGELAKKCPVLMNMVDNSGKRFIIVESVDKALDNRYYRAKLDELYSAVAVTCEHAKSAFNHPLLDMARHSYQIVQMQKCLRAEASHKVSQLHSTIRERDTATAYFDVAKQRHSLLQAALQDRPQTFVDAVTAEHDAEGTEDAAALLLQYLSASQTVHTSPTRFVNAFTQLEDAQRRLQDMLAKLEKLLQDVRKRPRNVPKVDLEREIQSILTAKQVDDEGLGHDAPEEVEQRPYFRGRLL